MSDNCFWTNEVGCIEQCAQAPAFALLSARDVVSGAPVDDEFGTSADISGNVVIVGSPNEGTIDRNGRVFVYELAGESWAQQDILIPSWDGTEEYGEFGDRLGIDGDYCAVAAPGAKRVTVFHRSGASWAEQDDLLPAGVTALSTESYASDVAISGGYVLASAPDDDDAAIRAGAVYVFSRSGGIWSQSQKLTASDSEPEAEFGAAVAMSGEYAIIGAPSHAEHGSQTGAAYIFKRGAGGSYTQQARLIASDAQAYEYFGEQVAISENYAIVSAYAGWYVFARTGASWTEVFKIAPPVPAGDGTLVATTGRGLHITDTHIFVNGYHEAGPGDPGSMAIFIFERQGATWNYMQTLMGPADGPGVIFGNDVAVSGSTVLVSRSEQSIE